MLSELRVSGAVLPDTFGIWVLFQGLERATFSCQRQGEKSLWEQINKRKAHRACRCSIHSFKHFSPTPLRWRYSHLLITHILGYISESGAKTKGKLCFIVTTVCLSKHDITLSPPCGTESRFLSRRLPSPVVFAVCSTGAVWQSAFAAADSLLSVLLCLGRLDSNKLISSLRNQYSLIIAVYSCLIWSNIGNAEHLRRPPASDSRRNG